MYGTFPIRVLRQYDSQTDYDSPLGHGWAFEFDRRLYQYPDNSVVVRYGNGIRDKYTYSGGAYQAPVGVGRLATLVQKPDGTFELTYLNGIRDHYDVQGRLTAIRDPQGNRLEMSYDPAGKLPLVGSSRQSLTPTTPFTVAYNYRLTRIDERAVGGTLTGHYLTFTYDPATGRLTGVTSNDGRTVTYEHDVQSGGLTLGNLTQVNGLEGIVSQYQYNDPNDPHNVTTDIPVVGETAINNTYDAQDRVTQQIYGASQFDFDYAIPLTKTAVIRTVRDQNGANPYTATTTYEFDPTGKITKMTDALGNEWRYTLNARKLITRQEVWQNNGGNLTLYQTINWTLDAAGNKLTEWVTLDSGETITKSWTYDHNWIASEQSVSSAAPSKIFRTEYTFYYNGEGVPVNVKDVKSRKDDGSFQTKAYEYDSRNRLLKTALPDGVKIVNEYTGEWVTQRYFEVSGSAIPQAEMRFDYDAYGYVNKRWDARNYLTTFVNDKLGRITSMTNALGEQTIYTYAGRRKAEVEVGRTVADGGGQVFKLLYDSRSRLIGGQRKNDSGVFVDFVTLELDSDGSILTHTDGSNLTTAFAYDLLGRRISMTDALSHTTIASYDAIGNVVSIKDALDHETRFEYDDANRRVAVVQLGVVPSPRTELGYDAVGNLISVKDAENHTTVYAYDALSRRTSVTQPLSQQVQYVYDNRDRLDYWINARGNKIDYDYELWGPVKSEKHYATVSSSTPTRTITLVRDNSGNSTSLTDDAVLATPMYVNTFDELGRLYDSIVKYIPGGDRTLQQRYDRYGNRKQLNVVDGTTIGYTYTYNKLDQLISATLAGAPLSLNYFGNDDRQSISMPGGVTRSFTYWSNGPVKDITVTGSLGQLAQWAFVYDDARNLDTLTDVDGVHNYDYDGLDRITQVSHPAPSGLPSLESYSYDRVGNREAPGNSALYGYDNNNRITTSPGLTYTADADGSVATRSDGATFTHDALSRLTQYSRGATTATYVHDALARRIKKTVGSTTTWFLWDGIRVISEYDGTGARTKRYGYLGSDYVPTQIEDVNGVYYVHSDQAQAPRLATSASSGQIMWRATYQSFGGAVVNQDADGNSIPLAINIRYPGQYADSESGLSYNLFRIYDPNLGRYIQPDPSGQMSGANLYLYAANNPVRFVDPLGLSPTDVDTSRDDALRNGGPGDPNLEDFSGSGPNGLQAVEAELRRQEAEAAAAEARAEGNWSEFNRLSDIANRNVERYYNALGTPLDPASRPQPGPTPSSPSTSTPPMSPVPVPEVTMPRGNFGS